MLGIKNIALPMASTARSYGLGPMPWTALDGLLQKGIRCWFVIDSGWLRVTTNKLVGCSEDEAVYRTSQSALNFRSYLPPVSASMLLV